LDVTLCKTEHMQKAMEKSVYALDKSTLVKQKQNWKYIHKTIDKN